MEWKYVVAFLLSFPVVSRDPLLCTRSHAGFVSVGFPDTVPIATTSYRTCSVDARLLNRSRRERISSSPTPKPPYPKPCSGCLSAVLPNLVGGARSQYYAGRRHSTRQNRCCSPMPYSFSKLAARALLAFLRARSASLYARSSPKHGDQVVRVSCFSVCRQ
ncbi:hypothetical protein FKP32DRAFT_755863 [Trametes sanguinea]|nr:hypothetical protein FKP32DRAFT_755863 [Trametes sanguinea]